MIERVPLVGAGVDRVDGPRKVTGTAPYPSDLDFPDLAHAALVRATIAAGKVRRVDTGPAQAAPGVLAVITHHNAPKLERGPATSTGVEPPPPLQDDRILHHGQYVAVVMATTAEQAGAAARLLEVDYDPAEPLLDLDDPRGLDAWRGDVAAGLAAAEVTLQATYTTPDQTHNPLGLFAAVAVWDGDALTVHTANMATTDGSGRIANATLGDYLVAVNADVPDLEVLLVGEPDRFNPIGVKGVGELGLVGIAAAIANAVFHATGRRVRSLPITIDQLL